MFAIRDFFSLEELFEKFIDIGLQGGACRAADNVQIRDVAFQGLQVAGHAAVFIGDLLLLRIDVASRLRDRIKENLISSLKGSKEFIVRKAKRLMIIFIGLIILGTFFINFAGVEMTSFMNQASTVSLDRKSVV